MKAFLAFITAVWVLVRSDRNRTNSYSPVVVEQRPPADFSPLVAAINAPKKSTLAERVQILISLGSLLVAFSGILLSGQAVRLSREAIRINRVPVIKCVIGDLKTRADAEALTLRFSIENFGSGSASLHYVYVMIEGFPGRYETPDGKPTLGPNASMEFESNFETFSDPFPALTKLYKESALATVTYIYEDEFGEFTRIIDTFRVWGPSLERVSSKVTKAKRLEALY